MKKESDRPTEIKRSRWRICLAQDGIYSSVERSDEGYRYVRKSGETEYFVSANSGSEAIRLASKKWLSTI